MRRCRDDRSRRGVATLIAVVLMSMVALCLWTMSMRFGFDHQRTRDAVAQTQLRQMLLAGADAAHERMEEVWEPTAFDVALPEGLSGEDSFLRVETRAVDESADEFQVDVIAGYAGQSTRQALVVQRDGGGAVEVVSATLGSAE